MPTKRSWSVLAVCATVLCLGRAEAWGTHNQITRWALEVVPQPERWQQALGPANWKALNDLSWLPDQLDQDLGSCYANDYLLLRALPYHVVTIDPPVRVSWPIHFRRSLQALRTETPVNAARQMGPLLHFVQDPGAPSHAHEPNRLHSERENWGPCKVDIRDYQPRLLGTTDDDAVRGLEQRMDGLIAFARAKSLEVWPLVTAPAPDRSKIDPILLLAGQECARVTADVVYTLLTLGLAPQPAGGAIEGTISAPEMPLGNNHGARVVLLDTDYATLATTAPGASVPGSWRGELRWHHLPAGTYRALVYRTAARPWTSPPFTVKVGETTRLDVQLSPAEPLGNLVENPDGRLCYLKPNEPDRWRSVGGSKAPAWLNMPVRLLKGHRYRVGLTLKDASAKAYVSLGTDSKREERELVSGQEQTIAVSESGWTARLRVATAKPLSEVLERAWVVVADGP